MAMNLSNSRYFCNVLTSLIKTVRVKTTWRMRNLKSNESPRTTHGKKLFNSFHLENKFFSQNLLTIMKKIKLKEIKNVFHIKDSILNYLRKNIF